MTSPLRTELAQLDMQARLTAEYQREMSPVEGTCLLAYRGSVAHGLYTGDGTESTFDDVDLMGVVIGEPRHYLGLYKWGEQEYGVNRECLEIKQGRWDIVYYELRKLIGLLLKGNPNVVSLLWLQPQDYVVLTRAARTLLDNRQLFLSSHVYNAFGAYALAQLAKMESRDPAELRDYLALTAEAKRRGIHPNHPRKEFVYPQAYDHDSGEARNAAAHSDSVLVAKLRHYMKKGDNTGYMGEKRKRSVLERGFDCYEESATEFLTSSGWRKYDDIQDRDVLIVVDLESGVLEYSKILSRTDKQYTGLMYTLDSYGTRATVTPNHNLLVSPAHRSKINNFSNRYHSNKANWSLVPVSHVLEGRRSHYHIRRAAEWSTYALNIESISIDERHQWLALMGLFLSDGSFGFREDGAVKALRLTQQEHNHDFCKQADHLLDWCRHKYGAGSKHIYPKETIWIFPVKPARVFYDWCGHSDDKHLPPWCFGLSGSDAAVLWTYLNLGDGTERVQNTCYYSSSARLASDIQAAMVSAGYHCTMYGPYRYDVVNSLTGKVDGPKYHVVLPSSQERIHCLNTGRVLHHDEAAGGKRGFPIKEKYVEDCRIVCLESETGTLITRNSGKVAIQGNSKNAAHCIRLLRMALEFKRTGELVVRRTDAEELLDIKTGASGWWTLERVKQHAGELYAEMEAERESSTLPEEPDYAAADKLLVEVLSREMGCAEG